MIIFKGETKEKKIPQNPGFNFFILVLYVDASCNGKGKVIFLKIQLCKNHKKGNVHLSKMVFFVHLWLCMFSVMEDFVTWCVVVSFLNLFQRAMSFVSGLKFMPAMVGAFFSVFFFSWLKNKWINEENTNKTTVFFLHPSWLNSEESELKGFHIADYFKWNCFHGAYITNDVHIFRIHFHRELFYIS